MALYLFDFVYNTLMQKANDNSPGNSLFLPVALSNMKNGSNQPYLPLKANNFNLNNISGLTDFSNDLAAAWWNGMYPEIWNLSQAKPSGSVTQQMIDDANAAVTYVTGQGLNVVPLPNTGPNLSATNIEIQGLANILVDGQPSAQSNAQGYNAPITLKLNAYPNKGDSWNQPLALAGSVQGTDSSNSQPFQGLNFTLTQTLCFVTPDGQVVAPPPTLHLPPSSVNQNAFDCSSSGIALLNLTDAKIVADAKVTVSNAPALQIGLNSLQLNGQQSATPVYTLQNLEYQNLTPIPFPTYIDASIFYSLWNQFFTEVLATGDATRMLTTQVNNALSSPSNLSQVEQLLDSQLTSVFNDLFGSTQVAGGGVDTNANAVDKYLFDRARGALNDRSSYVYLPALVLGSNSPTLEPYTATNLNIPGPFSTTVFSQSVNISDIVLKNLVINGLSNLVAPPNNIVFGANQQASATLLLGTLNPGPTLNVNNGSRTVPSPPATASTPFTLKVQVNTNKPIPISGTFNITLQNNSNTLGVQTALSSSGDTPQTVELTYSNITLVAGDNDVNLQVILPPDEQQYEKIIDHFLSQPALIQGIISALNGYIGQNLSQISQSATQFVRNALKNLGH